VDLALTLLLSLQQLKPEHPAPFIPIKFAMLPAADASNLPYQSGAEIARRLRFGELVTEDIRARDELWDGG
jgi:hypothetical protein